MCTTHSDREFPDASAHGNFPRGSGQSPLVRDPGFIPGPGRSLGKGNGYPLQYSCLENPTDREAWRLQSMGSQRIGHD